MGLLSLHPKTHVLVLANFSYVRCIDKELHGCLLFTTYLPRNIRCLWMVKKEKSPFLKGLNEHYSLRERSGSVLSCKGYGNL